MYQPQFKMEVVFDEEKVEREGKYDIDEMYKRVDDYLTKLGQKKITKGVFADTGDRNDYAHQGLFYMTFCQIPWFMDNLSVWNWWESDDDNPEEMWAENLLIPTGILKEGMSAYGRTQAQKSH